MKRNILFIAIIITLCSLLSGCDFGFGPGVKLETYSPTNITSHSAMCGVEIKKINTAVYYGELGVCWSTSPQPTYIEDRLNTVVSNHISTSDLSGPFTGIIAHLKPNTRYYVRAYLKNMSNQEIYYGKTKSFKTASTENGIPVEGSLSGKFSVGDGEQICFSKGNLQYHPVLRQWRFAEHQWDIIGKENANISETYNGWIDLFGWRTSGYDDIQPYTSFTQTQYYGPLTANMAGTNYDWGVYNAISNGGNQSGLWRTMDWTELTYIMEKRQTSSGYRFALAKVNNVDGLILLPDDWKPSYYTLYNVNEPSGSYDFPNDFGANPISQSDWINCLENHGAVFLPAAGIRVGNKTDAYSYGGPGADGRYWTSTWFASDRAVSLYFMKNLVRWNDFPYVNLGLSVRLVRNVD